MTYLESAVADFTKSVLTNGLRTLFTRQYLPYTLTAVSFIVFNSIVSLSGNVFGLQLDDATIDLLLSFEVALGVAFVITGMLVSRFEKYWLDLIFIFLIASSFFFAVDLGVVSIEQVGLVAGLLFIMWTIIATISQYTFFRDLFGHYVFGGILFFGKPEDDGKVLFDGTIGIITFVNLVLGYVIFRHDNSNQSLQYLGLLIIIGGLLNFLPLLHIQSKGDVFFTALTWFYALNTVRTISIVLQIFVFTEDGNNSSIVETFFTLFMVLFAVHKAAQQSVKIGKKLSELTDYDYEASLKTRPDLGIFRFIGRLFGDQGVVLLILGFVIGYHATQVQIRLGSDNLLNIIPINQGLSPRIWSNEISLITALLIYLATIFLYLLFPRFREYASPEIFRAPWAPPYEEAKLLIQAIREGRVDYKTDLLKMTASLAKNQLSKKLLGRKVDHERTISGTLRKLINKSKETKDNKK